MTLSRNNSQLVVCEKDADFPYSFNFSPFSLCLGCVLFFIVHVFLRFHNPHLQTWNIQFIAFARTTFILQDAFIQTYDLVSSVLNVYFFLTMVIQTDRQEIFIMLSMSVCWPLSSRKIECIYPNLQSDFIVTPRCLWPVLSIQKQKPASIFKASVG